MTMGCVLQYNGRTARAKTLSWSNNWDSNEYNTKFVTKFTQQAKNRPWNWSRIQKVYTSVHFNIRFGGWKMSIV